MTHDLLTETSTFPYVYYSQSGKKIEPHTKIKPGLIFAHTNLNG